MKDKKSARDLLGVFSEGTIDPWLLAQRCKAHYVQPTVGGKPAGPLVGYAGKDNQGRNYVGREYLDFSKMETHHFALSTVSWQLRDLLIERCTLKETDAFVGLPLGGLMLSAELSKVCDRLRIFPEKKVTKVATEDSREESELVFGRHIPQNGWSVVVVEDVCNNFSTTDKVLELIDSFGARVIAITCFLNRSTKFETEYQGIPIIANVRREIPQWEQDDPEVKDQVENGDVIWKPKNDWRPLAKAMAEAS